MAKNDKKSNGANTDNKIGVIDFVQTLNDSQSKIGAIAIYHNSRDKYDSIWQNRVYGVKAKFDKINSIFIETTIYIKTHIAHFDLLNYKKTFSEVNKRR